MKNNSQFLKLFCLWIVCTLSLLSHGQTYGYFGKKNTLSISGIGTMPLYYALYNRARPNYKSSGKTLTEKQDLFDGGFNISFSHSFKGKIGVGMEYNQFYGSVKCPIDRFTVEYFGLYYDYKLKHEELDIKTHTFMPKIEFSFNSNLLPIGINHQIGIGYTSTSVIEKDYIAKYNVQLNDYSGSESNKINIHKDNFIDYDALKSIKGITILYGFNLRKPIGRHVAINYGIRYTLNLRLYNDYPKSYGNYYSQTFEEDKRPLDFYISSRQIDREIQVKRIRSVLALQLGFTYIF